MTNTLNTCKLNSSFLSHVSVSSLKLSFEEKCHDLEMAKRNIGQLTAALDEKSDDALSAQELKTQSLAGELSWSILKGSRVTGQTKLFLANIATKMVMVNEQKVYRIETLFPLKF